jgi:hypothetical protein
VPSELFLWLFYINFSMLCPIAYASYNFIQSHRTLKHLPEGRHTRAAKKISRLFNTLMVLLVVFWLPTAALMWAFAGIFVTDLETSTYMSWSGGTLSHLQGAVSALVSLHSLYRTKYPLPKRDTQLGPAAAAAHMQEKSDVLSSLNAKGKPNAKNKLAQVPKVAAKTDPSSISEAASVVQIALWLGMHGAGSGDPPNLRKAVEIQPSFPQWQPRAFNDTLAADEAEVVLSWDPMLGTSAHRASDGERYEEGKILHR